MHKKKGNIISYAEAINLAQTEIMDNDDSVIILGLGVTSPTGVFGSVKDINKKFPNRVLETPASENCITGIAIGASIISMKPILIHQRLDFALLSIEQIVNQAAKWFYMYGEKMTCPIVIRMVIGRGWGQGPQHSQSLQSWFAHIPGLKVLMPTFAVDAYNGLIMAINDPSPVLILEHRWLYDLKSQFTKPDLKELINVGVYQSRVVRIGNDLTLIANSIMTIECIKVAELLKDFGINIEVIDLFVISPLDSYTILTSVAKTKNAIIVDNAFVNFGISAEISAVIVENLFDKIERPPGRIGFPNKPLPASPELAKNYFPTYIEIYNSVLKYLKLDSKIPFLTKSNEFLDTPNPDFIGPY
jgi:pyruvate dehydrogenase E1 component beta subunit